MTAARALVPQSQTDHLLQSRRKQLEGFSYKLGPAGGYGLDLAFGPELDLDESEMSVVIPFADGTRRDGVGDLLEVAGIDCSRHRLNPVVLFDHGKQVVLPVALAEDPVGHTYTVTIDPMAKTASAKAFFYQGKGALLNPDGTPARDTSEHALFCEQLYDLMAKRYVRAGSIGYQVVKALPLMQDWQTGTPQGLHLLQTLMLECSAVVMPANADTVRKALSLPRVCGKPLSPVLVKSLEPYATARKAQLGYEGKARVRVDPEEALPYHRPHDRPIVVQDMANRGWRTGDHTTGVRYDPMRSATWTREVSDEEAAALRQEGTDSDAPEESTETLRAREAAQSANEAALRTIEAQRAAGSGKAFGEAVTGPIRRAAEDTPAPSATPQEVRQLGRAQSRIESGDVAGGAASVQAYADQRIVEHTADAERRIRAGNERPDAGDDIDLTRKSVSLPRVEDTKIRPARWKPGAGAIKAKVSGRAVPGGTELTIEHQYGDTAIESTVTQLRPRKEVYDEIIAGDAAHHPEGRNELDLKSAPKSYAKRLGRLQKKYGQKAHLTMYDHSGERPVVRYYRDNDPTVDPNRPYDEVVRPEASDLTIDDDRAYVASGNNWEVFQGTPERERNFYSVREPLDDKDLVGDVVGDPNFWQEEAKESEHKSAYAARIKRLQKRYGRKSGWPKPDPDEDEAGWQEAAAEADAPGDDVSRYLNPEITAYKPSQRPQLPGLSPILPHPLGSDPRHAGSAPVEGIDLGPLDWGDAPATMPQNLSPLNTTDEYYAEDDFRDLDEGPGDTVNVRRPKSLRDTGVIKALKFAKALADVTRLSGEQRMDVYHHGMSLERALPGDGASRVKALSALLKRVALDPAFGLPHREALKALTKNDDDPPEPGSGTSEMVDTGHGFRIDYPEPGETVPDPLRPGTELTAGDVYHLNELAIYNRLMNRRFTRNNNG